MRACWLKWVGRDWSISADYIWLNYSGANTVEYRDRPAGSESKLNTVSDGIKVIAMIGTLFKDYRPLKFFTLIALIFAIIGLALGIPIVVEYFQTGLVPRFPTAILAASFMFLCGLSLATGLILDSVAKVERKQWELQAYKTYSK